MENTQIVKDIAESYAPKTKEQTRFEELTSLDNKVKRPAEIFAYTFGCAGALVLGAGMCLTMGVIAAGASWAMPVGVVVGVLGLAIAGINYPVYRAILKRRKAKYADRILQLSNELLNK